MDTKNLEADIRELEELKQKIDLKALKQYEDLKKRIDSQIKHLATEIPDDDWAPDDFTMGKKDKWIGTGFYLLRTTKKIRKINTEKFINEFPLAAAAIATIPVGKAEEMIDKEELRISGVVEETLQRKYEAVVAKTVEAKPSASKRGKKKLSIPG